MKSSTPLPESYFDKYSGKKVEIKPFDPQTKVIAADYLKKLSQILLGLDLEVILRGSTAYEIAGKGEIEFGIYPTTAEWPAVLKLLTEHFGEPGTLEKNFARFNDVYANTEIEIILLKGYDAVVDKKLTQYLLTHPQLLRQYEKLKYRFCNSKKDYMIQKDKFFRQIIDMIPSKDSN